MAEEKKKTAVSVIIDGISGIFLPLVNLLSAAGILKGILAILTVTTILPGESETYLVLNAMADSLFYFLPMLLAFTAARKFGANPYTAVVIAGVLLYPSLTTVLEAGNALSFLGIPLKGVAYHSSEIPMIPPCPVRPLWRRGWGCPCRRVSIYLWSVPCGCRPPFRGGHPAHGDFWVPLELYLNRDEQHHRKRP